MEGSTKAGETKSAKPNNNIWGLFRHSDGSDRILMAIGFIGCAVDGSCTPLIMFVLSRMMNTFGLNPIFSLKDIEKDGFYLLCVAIGVGIGAFVEGVCWTRTAERQTSRLKGKYLKAVLRQDVAFFDTQAANSTYQIVSSISTDTAAIQDVLSDKLPNFLMNTSTFITAQIVSMVLSWRLAIVAVPLLSLLVLPGLIYGRMLAGVAREMQKAYGEAGGIAEQALVSIRMVQSYVGEKRVLEKFSAAMEHSLRLGIRQGLMKGVAVGSIGAAFAVWAFQAWYGSLLVADRGEKGGNVYNAGICIVIGGLALGNALPNLKYFSEATASSARILGTISRIPAIDAEDLHGETPENCRGEIQFKEIDFAYPSRPTITVLQKFSLTIPSGQTVGIVGTSGSGKSTIISLLQRFYDPINGEILLDGHDIRSLQIKWLRSQMGLVSQEPILFATTIKDNILFGKEGASMEEVVEAAMAANAHHFITGLPNGYDTQVGQLGVQLSGGQKQRIAIARALLRRPPILLLDEATSALDSLSELSLLSSLSSVYLKPNSYLSTSSLSLNHPSTSTTLIVVAHRLSTIRDAHLIAVLHSGRLVECAPPHSNSAFSSMMNLQTLKNPNPKIPEMVNYENPNPRNPEPETPIAPSPASHYVTPIKKPETKTVNSSSPSFFDLLSMASPEWKQSLMGCIGAMGFGAVQPVHSFCLGALLSTYFLRDNGEIKSQTRIYCFIFMSYALFSFVTNVLQHYSFAVMGERLVKRVREAVLMKTIGFEVGWFDREENSTGAICTRIATEASMVKSLLGDRLSLMLQAGTSATLAMVWGLALAWPLAIVIIALQPVIIGCFYLRVVLIKSLSQKSQKSLSESSGLVCEAVMNHRTVTAFSASDKILAMFDEALKSPKKESLKHSWLAGLGLSASQFLTATNSALIFWYGGWLLHKGVITYKHLLQTFFILVTTGRVIAEAGSMTSDLAKGMEALKWVFGVLERESAINPDNPDGLKPEKIHGHVGFKEVEFAYPSRPDQMVLKGLSFELCKGMNMALVGRSGCGKSTVIGLIERFYEPLNGIVEIDGRDLRTYNLRSLRFHIGLVSQEPALFAWSIRENIVYGKENASEAEIMEAAVLANVHEFVSGLKDGYDTYCGERGVQLSGGQKQRIALARVILKSPAILLLDEATSSLDNESERLVQEAMDKMMVGRTCLVVAHRFATIRYSQCIAVIEDGRIVEQGSHEDLLAKGDGGSYFSLLKLQQDSTEPSELSYSDRGMASALFYLFGEDEGKPLACPQNVERERDQIAVRAKTNIS